MYILRRLIFFAFLAGIYLAVAGAYEVFIQATALGKPQMISISELAKNVPSNRHLIVSGGRAMISKAVEYYQTRHGVREANSEIYFIPIEDPSGGSSSSASPVLLVKMTASQLEKAKANGGFDSSAIEGIRMTRWDLESKAEEYLVRSFGKPAIEKMVILEYKKEVIGIWQGLGEFLGGLLLIGGIITVKFYRLGASKKRPPRMPVAPSNAPSAPVRSNAASPAFRRKRMAVAVFVILFALLLSLVVIMSSAVWKRSIAAHANASDDPWSDWQLPVRIGDSLEAVRAKLGQESLDGNRWVEEDLKKHHMTGYKGDVDRQKLTAEKTMTLYWQDKGLGVWFEKGRVKEILVSTVDQQARDDGSSIRERKYDGPIVAGVTAVDGLDELVQKLGNPSEVADFNPNVKDYQWRRKNYVIHARISVGDLVTTGLPLKRHQVVGSLAIEDIAPYLQADRDEQLRREIVKKETASVALSGATLSPKEIFQKYSGRVVEVQAINSKGTVFSKGTGLIWRGTEILTNCHVVEEAYSLKIKRGNEVEEARFLGTGDLSGTRFSHFSTEQDWIQLYLSNNEIEFPPVVLADLAPEVGENVVVIGNPEGLTNSLSTGIVSGIREVGGNEWIQITAPVSHGSSGSPVFDSKGRLIGLATMMLVDGQNLNFATPIRQIAAAVAKKAEPAFLPLKSVEKDEEYQRRKWALLSGAHESKEIEAFGQEFLKKYSDPADKAQVYYSVVFAYDSSGQFRAALRVLKKKMELFGADITDYLLTANMLESANDTAGVKRELRAGITLGVRRFANEHLPDSRETASALGSMFDKLQDRQGATEWFDISLALMLPDIAEWSLRNLPKWYQSKRAARGKSETDAERLVPKDPDAYLNALRERWLLQNENEIVVLMRTWGLSDERANQILKMGIDSLSPSWWEQEVRPRITQEQWLALRSKLDERKSMQGGL